MRGPWTVPSATARARWTPSPHSSRMLVKPAETATSASFVARAASTARGVRVISSTFSVRIPMKCPWTSHIPGMSAGTFTTVAPAAEGAPSIGPAYAIVGPSTINAAFRIGSPRPGIRTSASIRSIGFAIAAPPKNVAAMRDREPYGSVPVPATMAGFVPPEVGRALDARFPEALEYTRRLLRQPSVSATGEGIRECSELVRQMMADIGCKTCTWAKGGHPLVIGELDVGAPVTLIVYEMYDVQPVGDLNAWQAPPFAAEIRDVPGVGRAIIGRGSTNSKGALANHLFTWKTIRDVDEMPVNLKILAEGEEEISSANFIAYIRTHRRELKADAAIANDYSEDLRGVPTIYLGVKGCLYLTVWSRGNPQAGGPMDSEIHSSNAVWIGSPVWRLLQALNTLVDEDQRPAIDGIWDDVVPPTKRDSAMVKTLAKTFDPSAWLQEERTAKFKFDLPKDELLLKYLFEPTVNICGIYSGYIEHGGTKTVLPHEAYAKIDIRLVKDMTVEGTLRKLRAHLKKRGYDDLRIEVHGPYGPAKTDPGSWIAKAAVEAVEANGKQPEVWPSSGGTMPAFAFDEYLKLPWVSMGLGHGSRAHAPNEYASIDGMKRFMAGEATLLYAAAKRAPKRPR